MEGGPAAQRWPATTHVHLAAPQGERGGCASLPWVTGARAVKRGHGRGTRWKARSILGTHGTCPGLGRTEMRGWCAARAHGLGPCGAHGVGGPHSPGRPGESAGPCPGWPAHSRPALAARCSGHGAAAEKSPQSSSASPWPPSFSYLPSPVSASCLHPAHTQRVSPGTGGRGPGARPAQCDPGTLHHSTIRFAPPSCKIVRALKLAYTTFREHELISYTSNPACKWVRALSGLNGWTHSPCDCVALDGGYQALASKTAAGPYLCYNPGTYSTQAAPGCCDPRLPTASP